MTPSDRFERELPLALADITGSGNADYLTDILGRTARTRQRPAWASLERWLPMDLATPRAATARIPWRPIIAVALVALLAVALVAVYAGAQRRVPPPFGPAKNGLIPYDANGDIFVGDPVTGTTRLIVGGPENDYGPTFSPDGTRIAFVRAAPSGEDLYVVNADGSDPKKITPEPMQGFVTATWTPASDGMLVGYDVNSVQRLEVIDAAGKAPARLIKEGLSIDWALYRPPNGTEVLVRGKLKGVWGLYAMGSDGSNIRLLAAAKTTGLPDQDLNFPTYSPDGTQIYYNRYTPEVDTIQAWVMNADGSNQHRFNASGPASGWWEGETAPSLDGRSVAMWRVPASGHGVITVFPADGSGEGRPIGPQIPGTARWLWAPDSTSLLVTPNSAADGGQVLVNPIDGSVTAPAWTTSTVPDWQRRAR